MSRFVSRRAPRRDANEKAICAALQALGCVVVQVSGVGAPDLLVRARDGRLHALEVKTAKGIRTDAQEVSQWPIVRSIEDALKLIGVVR